MTDLSTRAALPSALQELVAELERAGEDEATLEIAAEALSQPSTPRELVLALALDRAPAVRRAVALALGRRGEREARPRLEQLLDDAQGEVRAAACGALAALGDAAATTGLVLALDDRLPAVRAAAAKALSAFPGREPADALDQLLRRERAAEVQRAAVLALVAAGERDPALQEPVLVSLASFVPRAEDPDLRAAATERLVELAGRRSKKALRPIFGRVPRSGREALALSLRQCARPLSRGLEAIELELRHLPPDPDLLARFGSNLSLRARQGELARAHGREAELKAIRDRLTRPGPKSVVLTGPSGVGKTAIIHELTRRLAEEPALVPWTVLEATTGEVLSGTRYLGDWQTRLKELQQALAAPRRALWYVPDLNRLVDAGVSEHSQDSFATMLAPALERGELVIVGESTAPAFHRGLDRFPAFKKLFWRLEVAPPSPLEARALLGRVAEDLAAEQVARGVELVVAPEALDLALDLADDHLAAQARPGNGVRLLRDAVSAALQEAEDARAGADEDDGAPRRVLVSPGAVLATLSRLTGVPVRLLDDSQTLDLAEVRAFFLERVLGQHEAVETVVDLISLIKAGLSDPERPLGVLLFVGPTGVGKTEMAKALAELIFGSSQRLVRVDLGEFRDPTSLRRLTGDPHAPEPAARSGLLTAPVRSSPFSVVLLDELEKAHDNVFDLLLPLLDEGRLVDELGRVTDFRRCIIVMTSNLGSDLSEGTQLGFEAGDAGEAREAKVRRALEGRFRAEFLNRIRETVVFAPLTQEVMRRLTRRELRRVLQRKGLRRRGVVVETDDAVIGTLVEAGFSEHFGARHLKRCIEDLLLKPLARAINRVRPGEGEAIVRLRVGAGRRLESDLLVQRAEEEEEPAPAPARASARVRDPRRGRLVSVDEIEDEVLELTEKVEAIEAGLEQGGLRGRKSELLAASQAPSFWVDQARARATLAEIATIERTLETPGHLQGALERLERLLSRARGQTGETRELIDLLDRLEALRHEVELALYAVHCGSPQERGDAALHLRRIDDGAFPGDPVALLATAYKSYLRGKRYQVVVVYEGVDGAGVVRVAGLRVEGPCAFGLLRGEEGLHEWVHRDPERRRQKQTAFVRVGVLPPAPEPLRPHELTVERRALQDVEGVLLKRHRQHLVLTHTGTQVALDGSVADHPEAERDALEHLAARVAAARRPPQKDPGVVRRYTLGNHPSARDLVLGVRLHLDPVLEGKLDPFVLPRVLGTTGAG